ncbi:GlcG protein [Pseudomonas aeruginosa]|nr:GlcG protein [Pseudomonas aeruginosa]
MSFKPLSLWERETSDNRSPGLHPGYEVNQPEKDMHHKAVLTQTEVARILAAARAEAQRNQWAVAIALVDDGGHPLALERLDGCAPVGAYIATEKARSSALGRRETKGYEEMVNGGRTAFVSAPLLTSWKAACRCWSMARWSARWACPASRPSRTLRWPRPGLQLFENKRHSR